MPHLKLSTLTLALALAIPVSAQALPQRSTNYTPAVFANGEPIVVAQRRQCTTVCNPNPIGGGQTCRTVCY